MNKIVHSSYFHLKIRENLWKSVGKKEYAETIIHIR